MVYVFHVNTEELYQKASHMNGSTFKLSKLNWKQHFYEEHLYTGDRRGYKYLSGLHPAIVSILGCPHNHFWVYSARDNELILYDDYDMKVKEWRDKRHHAFDLDGSLESPDLSKEKALAESFDAWASQPGIPLIKKDKNFPLL